MKSMMLVAILICAGCASAFQPASKEQSTKQSHSDVYGCANGMVNRLGYTVQDASKDSGFIRAERKVSGIGRSLMVGTDLYDSMTIAVFQDPATQLTTLRITAASVDEMAEGLKAGHRETTHPRKELEADVDSILAACAK